jgi:hypothetical protein
MLSGEITELTLTFCGLSIPVAPRGSFAVFTICYFTSNSSGYYDIVVLDPVLAVLDLVKYFRESPGRSYLIVS